MFSVGQALRALAVAATVVLLVPTVAASKGQPVEPGKLGVEVFTPSTGCTCHSQLVRQWSRSMHAQALTDPIYLAKLEEARRATGGQVVPFCNKCHGPIATITGEMDGGNLSPASAEGVACTFCHYVSGIAGEPANVAQLVESDGVRRAQITDPKAPHPATYSQLHEKSELCGGCHNVNHPVNGLPLESTYSEWLAGPYAKEGIDCQDCHMSGAEGGFGPVAGQACVGGVERQNIFHMSFVGAQVELGPPDLARAQLRRAAEVSVEMSEVVAPGETATVTVTITNKGAGHYLPTGLTEVRQMWLEVYAEDPSGRKTAIGERRFGTVLKDAKGAYPAELWNAAGVQSDDRIPPRQAVTSTYAFTMPNGAKEMDVSAVLLYKSAPDELAKKAGVDNPTTEMASAKATIVDSAEKPATPVESEDDSRRMSDVAAWLAAIAAVGVAVATFLARSRGTR